MPGMRMLFGVVLLSILACAPEASTLETSTTLERSPASLVTTTTAHASLEVEIDDCSAPQVTFSPLCETYELIQRWHVDRPIDAADLAAAAMTGLDAFAGELPAEPPRKMICAIPDQAFEQFCLELGRRVEATSIPIGEAIEAAVLTMANLGLDPFSYYLPPDQVGTFRANGVVGGVGIMVDARDAVGSKCVQVTVECPLRIIFVLEDNPGDDAGLATDDIIVSVDGARVEGKGFVDVAAQIAGNETGTVMVTVERAGQEIQFEIQRAQLTVPAVEIAAPSPGVGYIRIPDFESDIPDLVAEALVELTSDPLDTLVIDLRDNPGGFVDAAVEVVSEFVEGGVALRTVGPGEDLPYPVGTGGLAIAPRLIILVNQGTASAAEVMTSALRDLRGAPVIGDRTFGKDAVQIPFELRNGGEFYVAVARWLSPNGNTVANGGLIPDHLADLPQSLTIEEVVEVALRTAP